MKGALGAGFTDRNIQKRKSRRCLLFLFFILILLSTGIGLTGDNTQKKAQKIVREKRRTRNMGCKVEQLNPLRKNRSPELRQAVRDYYRCIAEKTDFVETYNHLQIYIKDGEYADTYVAFVMYRMKIKQVYTELPGVGTLYITEKDGKNFQVRVKQLDRQEIDHIKLLAGQHDVKALLEKSRRQYQTTLKSDALLAESVKELQKALNHS